MTIRTLQPGDVLELAHFGPATVVETGKDPKTRELIATVLTLCGETIYLTLRYAARRLHP